MGILSDAARAAKDVLLLKARVEDLEKEMEHSRDMHLDHEKRLIRIETMIEMAQRGSGNLRLDD